MTRIRSLLVGATAVSLLGLVAGPATGGPGLLKNKYSPDPVTVECFDDQDNKVGEVVYDGPLKLWPPNHKYEQISVTATAEDDDDDVTLSTEGTHDEFAEDGTEMNGAGNTDDDVEPAMASDGPNDGSAATEHSLRSERSGQGDGRTYTIDWQATFTDDDMDDGYGQVMCGSADLDESGFDPNADAFEVFVPHDMRCGADWKGGNNGNGGNGQCAKSE